MFDIRKLVLASSIDMAVEALKSDPEARIIAGGTDVLIRLREGKGPSSLVSIHDISALRGVTTDQGDNIHIGPLTTFRDLELDPIIGKRLPILAQAASTVGGPQIRAMGTIGGNICNGVTSADTASTLLALDASLTIAGPTGNRLVSISEFYLGPGQVDLGLGELLVMITIHPSAYQGFGGCYLKYSMRQAMDISTLGTALLVKPDHTGRRVDTLRLAFGVAAPTPLRCTNAELALMGQSYAAAAEQIGSLVQEEINPRTSWRASREFRLHIAGENARRALRAAFIQAGGDI